MQREEVLADLLSEITRRFGGSVTGRIREDALLLVCEANGGAIGVSVDDASRPSFSVSYPGFGPEAASWRDQREFVARNVLLPGLLWIVRAVEDDGAVLPEFPKPGLRRSAKRTPSK